MLQVVCITGTDTNPRDWLFLLLLEWIYWIQNIRSAEKASLFEIIK